jgi:hypothetical protein
MNHCTECRLTKKRLKQCSGERVLQNANFDAILSFGEGADTAPTISRVIDINDKRPRLAHRERWAQSVRELTVGDQHLRVTVVEQESDGPSIEPHVERVEHGATHRYTDELWCIPEQRCHRIAAANAALRVGLGPREAPVHVDDRRLLWTGRGAPIENWSGVSGAKFAGFLSSPISYGLAIRSRPLLDNGSEIQHLSKLV